MSIYYTSYIAYDTFYIAMHVGRDMEQTSLYWKHNYQPTHISLCPSIQKAWCCKDGAISMKE